MQRLIRAAAQRVRSKNIRRGHGRCGDVLESGACIITQQAAVQHDRRAGGGRYEVIARYLKRELLIVTRTKKSIGREMIRFRNGLSDFAGGAAVVERHVLPLLTHLVLQKSIPPMVAIIAAAA